MAHTNSVIKHIHFIGIGGISMSSLAMASLNSGYTVSGSDMNSTHITRKLSDNGIKIYEGHAPQNICGADVVVYTAAIKPDNPEYAEAVRLNIPLVERCVFLGNLMKDYKIPCCISGTHGKTTTTSMVSVIMEKAKLNPTLMVGGEVKALGGNYKIGGKDIFVTEACEYVESFLKFFPHKAVILNIEEDHLDYFRDINHIISAFSKFLSLVPENGTAIINGNDKNSLKAAEAAKCNIITFGIGDGYTYSAKNIVFDKNGFASYDLTKDSQKLIRINLGVPGKHNILNSLAACALCLDCGCTPEDVASGLEEFHGTDRRFEIKGSFNGVCVVDDYAHHPTEIKAALDTARSYCSKKITAIFQSHTYTRTKALLEDFSKAFDNADKIIVTDIYAAREKDTGLVTPQQLVDLMKKNGYDASYIGPFEKIADYVKNNTAEGELVITIGAGNVYKIADMLVK